MKPEREKNLTVRIKGLRKSGRQRSKWPVVIMKDSESNNSGSCALKTKIGSKRLKCISDTI